MSTAFTFHLPFDNGGYQNGICFLECVFLPWDDCDGVFIQWPRKPMGVWEDRTRDSWSFWKRNLLFSLFPFSYRCHLEALLFSVRTDQFALLNKQMFSQSYFFKQYFKLVSFISGLFCSCVLAVNSIQITCWIVRILCISSVLYEFM